MPAVVEKIEATARSWRTGGWVRVGESDDGFAFSLPVEPVCPVARGKKSRAHANRIAFSPGSFSWMEEADWKEGRCGWGTTAKKLLLMLLNLVFDGKHQEGTNNLNKRGKGRFGPEGSLERVMRSPALPGWNSTPLTSLSRAPSVSSSRGPSPP